MDKKIVFTVLGGLILVAGIAAGVFLVGQNQEIREKAAPATSLSFASSKLTPKLGESFTVDVQVNTGPNRIVGADLFISFDKDKLEAVSVFPGEFLSGAATIGPEIDNFTGKISYTLYLPPQSTSVSGAGNLAVITFKTKSVGRASLNYLSDTAVGGIGEQGKNVLQNSTPLVITIAAQSTPTPSVNATPTATVGPTLSPSPTAVLRTTAVATDVPVPQSGSSGVSIFMFALSGTLLLLSLVLSL